MERITRHLSYANVIATLALVFAMTGGAIAATGGFTSGGKLQACVNEEGGLKLLKAGKRCKRGQKTVAWNQTGPAGARGTTGASGPAGASVQGPQGPQGAPGDQNVKWALVDQSGKVEAQKGVVSVTGKTSPYEVKFDRDISHCALVATPGGPTAGLYSNTEVDEKDTANALAFIEDSKSEDTPDRFSIVAYC